ncbi:MAG: PorT family protein [Phycisphaerae bacterium]|nr:PorT family protein [Saprospiraceae bacterium]
MKNLFLLLALVCSGPLFSQEKKETPSGNNHKEGFSLAVIGGLNISKMPFNPPQTSSELVIPSTKSVYAFFGGLSARKPISHRFAALLEATYSVRGFGYFSSNEISRFRFDYLDFVPQVEYNVFNNLYLSLGGYVGFRIKEHSKIGDSEWVTFDPKLVEFATDTDFGIVPGLTLRFEKVSVLVRYQYGLFAASNLDISNELGEPIGTIERQNRTFQIGLGFRIL